MKLWLALCLALLLSMSAVSRIAAAGPGGDDDVVGGDDEFGTDADGQQQDAQDGGDSGEAYDTEDEQGVGPAEDVDVVFSFHEAPDKKLKIGEVATLLVGLNNRGESVYNITGIGAHLHSPVDFLFFIQNFTATRVENVILGPGDQASVAYAFRPDPSLEAVEYWFSAWVLYNNTKGRVFLSTIYNGTVELVHGPESAGTSSTQVFGALLVALGIGAFLYQRAQNAKPARVERGTKSDANVAIYTPLSAPRRRK